MPLRATEMLFLEHPTVVCPHCRQPRPVADETCPHCGDMSVLESLSPHTSNFHISSLLLVTTLFAICFAAARIAIGVGVVAFMIAGAAALRTALLVGERKRFRYPISIRILLRLFGRSVVGIIFAIVIFGVLLFMGGVILGGVFSQIMGQSESFGLVCWAILMLAGVVAAIVLVGRRRESRLMLLIGAVVACLLAIAVLCIVRMGRGEWVEPLLLLSLPIGGLLTLCLACHRGGLDCAKSFLVGYAAGFYLSGAVALLLPGGRMQQGIAVTFVASGFLLWPALLTILALENFWSWDDAFPSVASRPRMNADSTRAQGGIVVIAEAKEGIEFSDGPSGGET